MSFNAGVEPVTELLEAIRGGTYRATIELWADEARTVPLDPSGITATLYIVGYETLTVGNGLTFTTGKLEVALTPEQTANAPAAQHHYYVALDNGTEKVFPVRGPFTFSNP